jgi:Tfp pilus assembly protein PilV
MRRFSVSADGISLVELLVAVVILSVINVVTIKLIGTTDKELLQSQGERKSQQTDEAIASFIYDDFQTGNLDL